MAVPEEMRAFNADLARLMASSPPAHTVPVEEVRAARRAGLTWHPAPVFLPQARDVSVPRRGGEVGLRVLAPEGEATGIYVHLHGGGFVFGRADEYDVQLWNLVEATGLCAVSVDYRLAPEHPFPAGPDDCEDAALWLLERGPAELGTPGRFVIGGESAGAYLAVLTLLRLRDRHRVTEAFAGANLVFGVYDLGRTPSSRLWRENLVLGPESMRWYADCFTPGLDDEARRDPELSPLYADLRELPPALFTTGTRDPLVDDTMFMEARWRLAGNETELQVFPEAPHGFTLFPLEAARLANHAQYEFLGAALER